MSYGLQQTRRFARAYKKLHDNVAADVDAATEVVATDPTVGERTKGELAQLLVVGTDPAGLWHVRWRVGRGALDHPAIGHAG